MAVEHVNVTDPNIHEPKGVAAAAVNKVYVADGAASGAWQLIEEAQIDATSIKNINQRSFTVKIDDVSTAGSYWVASPWAGTITKIYTVLEGAISGADAALSFELGGTAVTDGGITITQASSAAGDVDSSTPSAANTVTAGGAIEVITDGGSTGAVSVQVTFVLTL